jgi:hypothetical protein
MTIINNPYLSISNEIIESEYPSVDIRRLCQPFEQIRVYYSKDINNYFAYIKTDEHYDYTFDGDFVEMAGMLNYFYKDREMNLQVSYPTTVNEIFQNRLYKLLNTECSNDKQRYSILQKYLLLLI